METSIETKVTGLTYFSLNFYFINPCCLFIAALSSKVTDSKVLKPPVRESFVEDS